MIAAESGPTIKIHIPQGIRFDCTGCSNCCLGWPVPVTDEDFEAISRLLGRRSDSDFPIDTGVKLAYFAPLRSAQEKFAGFSRVLKKNSEGRCEFLTEDNRCQLHDLYGAQSKPAMCQLFPYTFNLTPSGVYASISFAATGALYNSGRLLSEQEGLLALQWELFLKLFPRVSPDWSGIQLVDGQKLDWRQFLDLDQELLSIISRREEKRIDDKLLDCSRFLLTKVLAADMEAVPRLESSPRTVDNVLIKNLVGFYLPEDEFNLDDFDFDSTGVLGEIVAAPSVVRLQRLNQTFTFGQLNDFKLGRLDEESEDLLRRFVYCRLFAKLYFGAGFHNLSLIVGIHHLIFLMTLVRLAIKMRLKATGAAKPEFAEIAELIRLLERRLSQASLSNRSVAFLEVLLKSPERARRLAYLSR